MTKKPKKHKGAQWIDCALSTQYECDVCGWIDVEKRDKHIDRYIQNRLEYLRTQIDNECISYSEIAELQDLAEYIDRNDVQLLQWANVQDHD